VTAQLLGDGLDLPCRDTLHIHLGQRSHQGTLGALIALEQLGGEPPLPILRHPQLQLADPGDQRAIVIARAVAEPLRRALALGRAQGLVHLGFQHLLQHRAYHRAQAIGAFGKKRLDCGAGRSIVNLGHGGIPLRNQ
jgi:hypothetical protein